MQFDDGLRSRVVAECCNADQAMVLAKELNSIQDRRAPELLRDDKMREILWEMRPLADMLDGRDNQNNWRGKVDFLLSRLEGGTAG